MSTPAPNPAGWPEELLPLFRQAVTCEFASLTRAGRAIAMPLLPFVGADGLTLDVSTGLAYPTKAERVRRNPKVALLYSDPVGSGLTNQPVALVTGWGAVRDRDLQANTDRYIRELIAKDPKHSLGMPNALARRLNWYFGRIWIEVVPKRILWWPGGRTGEPPRTWDAPEGTAPRESDPPPTGKAPAQWKDAPADWRTIAAHAIAKLGTPILTTVDADGFPTPIRVANARQTTEGFILTIPRGLPTPPAGPACLTFHSHPEVFTGQENRLFAGEVQPDGDGALFRVERPIADWSLHGPPPQMLWRFLSAGRKLAPRLHAEAARRGQPVPQVRIE
jgi:hypothetical protein